MLVHDLNSHADVFCHGELYSRGHTGPESYNRFRGRLPWRPPGRHLDAIFDRSEAAVGVKIMYNHLRLPLLRAALERRDVRIIHLVRDNILKQHVSYLAAAKRHMFAATSVPPAIVVECPVERLVEDLRRRQRLVERHRALCRNLDHIEVRYEALVADRTAQHQSLLKFLAVDPRAPLDGGRVKLNPDHLQSLVSNYTEVVHALNGTEFEALLD